MKSKTSANYSQGACPGLDQGIVARQHSGTIRCDAGGFVQWERPFGTASLLSPEKGMVSQANRLASFGKSEETLVESLHFAVPARVKRHRKRGSPAKEHYVPLGTPCWRTFSYLRKSNIHIPAKKEAALPSSSILATKGIVHKGRMN